MRIPRILLHMSFLEILQQFPFVRQLFPLILLIDGRVRRLIINGPIDFRSKRFQGRVGTLRLLPILRVDLLRQTLMFRLVVLFHLLLDARFGRRFFQFLHLLPQYADLGFGLRDLSVHLADLLQEFVFRGPECLILLLDVIRKGWRNRFHLGIVGARLFLTQNEKLT